jgi:hypothetical protein
MRDALHGFHTLKDVIFLERAGKTVITKANTMTTELMKM